LVESGSYPHSRPGRAAGEVAAVPIEVGYHWPAPGKSVAAGHKTVCAQKGTVVRVQVPEEIWAGESRPLFAVLNGAYNDGSPKTGDVPWSYEIEWQFAEPVWDEEGTGDDITYTPRPPDESQGEEIVPSTILTGRHRIKQNTSPLYLADMTSSAGGLAYARAIIRGVNISGGEVVQGTGTTELASAWVAVNALEEIETVDDQGYARESFALYSPDEIYKPPTCVDQDYLELLCVGFLAPPSDETVDVLSVLLYDEEHQLQETSSSSNVFENGDASFVVTLNTSDFMNPGVVDSLNVTVYNEQYDINNVSVDLVETDPDSGAFMKITYTVDLALVTTLSDTSVDEISVLIVSTHSRNSVRGVLRETGVDTDVFADETGINTLAITSLSGPTPTVVDTMNVRLDCYDIDAEGVECALTESDVATLVFRSHIDAPLAVDGFLQFTEQSRFKVVIRRWPGVIGDTLDAHIISPIDDVSVTVTASIWDNLWVSGALAAVTPDAPASKAGNNTYNYLQKRIKTLEGYEDWIEEAQEAKRYDLVITWCNTLVAKWKAGRRRGVPRKQLIEEWTRITALCEKREEAALRTIHGQVLLGTSLPGRLFGWTNHVNNVQKICETDLGMSANRITLRYFDFSRALRGERISSNDKWFRYGVYYTFSHSYADSSYMFQGLKLIPQALYGSKKKDHFTAASFSQFKHKPSLVFLNGCITSQSVTEYPMTATTQLANRFNARCYIGWRNLVKSSSGKVTAGTAAGAGSKFFELCAKKGYTVKQAMDDTNTAYPDTVRENANLVMAEGHADGNFSINKKGALGKYKKTIPAWDSPGPKP